VLAHYRLILLQNLINKTFTFKLFLSGNKFGLAGNILACLQLSANITIHNVVTGIINESQEHNLRTQFFAKNRLVESTDREAGLSDATSTEVSSRNSDEGLGSKVEMRKFHDVWKSEFL
jgi:hypothetical protein